MLEKDASARLKLCASVVTFLFVTGLIGVVKPTLAQQNGTTCPEYIDNGSDRMYLTLDAVCDGNGEPMYSHYPGMGARDGCYTGTGYGFNDTCEPCPGDWQNCTPCPNFDSECGEDTPDPPPDPGGSNQAPGGLQKIFNYVWSTLDWLTA